MSEIWQFVCTGYLQSVHQLWLIPHATVCRHTQVYTAAM